MRKKNWIEFDNKKEIMQDKKTSEFIKYPLKINVFSKVIKKKGKKITIIQGLESKQINLQKALLKKLKIFCSTGGRINDEGLELQGDLVQKVKEFLRKEGYEIYR